MDEELRESYRTLEKCLFHEGRIVTPSSISENNTLPFFQAVGLEPFLTLNEPICPKICRFKLTSSQLSRILQTPYALETFYTSKWSLNSLDDHPNSNFFGLKHDLIKKTITTPRTTHTQLLRDSNKLYLDDIRLELKGWELFFRENFFFSLGKKNKFTFHEHVMDPLDISRNPSKEKGKNIVSSSVISSSSSSSNDNKAPSFLEFYDELSDSDDLTKAQRKKRGMFKCLNRYVGTITKYMEKQK
ncbi:hypothetical protein Tco_0441202 [Tanacetum coccineum]